MRRLLKIGEAAALAGVTSKAIRHYHKVGLLAEPRRSESGYRLYGAEELLRLARIRRLRTLGLSLKQIKRVLGDKNGGHSLREALSVLHAEVTAEIGTLEERRMKIGEALAREDPDATESSTDEPEALRLTKDILGAQFSEISAEAWEQEKAAWGTVESFAWPEGYLEEQGYLARYYADRPEEYRSMLSLGEQLVTLTNVPEDSPEVDHLAREYIRHFETYPPSEMMPEGSVWASDDTHGGVFADILTSNMSPAQRRVLDLANEHFTEEEKP